MTTVFVYIFQGKYTGKSEYEYANPDVGAIHKCILYLSQDSKENQFEYAELEIRKYGFNEIENMRGNPLDVEVLNTESFKGFVGFYKEALEEGSCLVYYPNT